MRRRHPQIYLLKSLHLLQILHLPLFFESGSEIPYNAIISMSQSLELYHLNRIDTTIPHTRIEEATHLSEGLQTSMNHLEIRYGQPYSWSFDPYSIAASYLRWKDIAGSQGVPPAEQQCLDRGFASLLHPQRLANVTTPANFDLAVRVITELYRTNAAEDYPQEEEVLLRQLAGNKIRPAEFDFKLKTLYSRWASVRPFQLTQDLEPEVELAAYRDFARPARYELHVDPDTNMVLFWDNHHLFHQYTRHLVRLTYDGPGGRAGIRQKDTEISELRQWLESQDGGAFQQYQELLTAVDWHPEYWDVICYRIWLQKQISDTAKDASFGFRLFEPYVQTFLGLLSEEPRNRLLVTHQLPKFIYLGMESFTYATHHAAKGADIGSAMMGIKDGLTRGQIASPMFLRGQTEARHRFRTSTSGVWMHELSYILTAAMLELDYDMTQENNSGLLEGILHECEHAFYSVYGNEYPLPSRLEQVRASKTRLSLPPVAYSPRLVFAFDSEKDRAGELLVQQLGFRYLVDDGGVLRLPVKGLRNLIIKPNSDGQISFSDNQLKPKEQGYLRGFARVLGSLALWQLFWEEAEDGTKSQRWGSSETPGKMFIEKLRILGIDIEYPSPDQIHTARSFERTMRDAGRAML